MAIEERNRAEGYRPPPFPDDFGERLEGLKELAGLSWREFTELIGVTQRFDGWVELIQADGGSEFKESFAWQALTYFQRRSVARPYKKNGQAYIESFNRTVRKECLGWIHCRKEDLQERQRNSSEFLYRYHYHRPHLRLGLEPPLRRGEPALSDIYG